MQRTDFAPVLSATSSRDSVWIISKYSQLAPGSHTRHGKCSQGQSWARRPLDEPLILIPCGAEKSAPLEGAEPEIIADLKTPVKHPRAFQADGSCRYWAASAS